MFPFGAIAAMLVCAAAFLGIGAPAAGAAPVAGPGWAYESDFPDAVRGVTEPQRAPVAVDSHGNVVFVDEQTAKVTVVAPDAVDKWKALTTFGAGIVRNVAIDLSDDSIYLDETFANGGSTIRRWVSDGQPTPTYTLDPAFEVPQGESLAVDQSTGDVLVADPGAEAIRRYDSSGTPVGTIDISPIAPAFIATVPDGSLYVAPASGPDITHLSATGTVLETIAGVGAPKGIAWDETDELLIALVEEGNDAEAKAILKTYSPAGQLLSEVPAHSSSGAGLAFDPNSGRLLQGPRVGFIAYVKVTVPAVEAPVASGVTAHGVHVEAAVDPGAGPPADSKAHFEYSRDGGSTWKSTPDQELTSPGAATVEADLTGLLANTEYLVRVVASNPQASKTSSQVSFTTSVIPPEVVTAKATDVGETSAVLNGTVNPGGLQTTYHFEYGLTADYGSRVPVGIEAVAGSGFEPRALSRTISGLQPGTTYHFRIVAENSQGLSEGADETFTTVPAAGAPHRAYEQVTPADKEGIAIESGFGFYAEPDGNGMSYLSKGGGKSAPLNARSMMLRGSDDWEGAYDLDPPLAVSSVGVISQATLGLSSDFSRALVVSNVKLTPDAAEGPAANLYVVDIASGEYTLVGSTPPIFFALNIYAGFGFGGNMIDAAADFSWIDFYSQLPLIEGAPGNALYRWSEADGLEIASLLPGPTETPTSVAEIGAYTKVLAPWSAADGSRLYFDARGDQPGIYLREGGETKAVSVSQVPGEPTAPQGAQLFGTSTDGRYAFFSLFGDEGTATSVRLTSDAPGKIGDAYRYDASEESLEYLGDRVVNSNYQSGLGISEDGETFYFNAPQKGELFQMRVWRQGQLRTVSETQQPVLSFLNTMSPNGRYFAYSPTIPASGALRLYDAVTEESVCASCLSDGSPGKASLPNLVNRTVGSYLPHSVTDDGRFFFTSSSRLVAADVNGVNDVYEFKDGKASLVSPGNAPFPATFADISGDGSDVFFTTQQKLVGRDNDDSVDIYDARIGGGLPAQSPPPPQECLRDDCKATPGAGPELPFGGSEALSGPGNVTPPKRKHCGKGKRAKKVKGKVRCVKKHKANKEGKGGNR
jgi:hypothetical protein